MQELSIPQTRLENKVFLPLRKGRFKGEGLIQSEEWFEEKTFQADRLVEDKSGCWKATKFEKI